jgi:multidrug efflux system membrane fusion protein
MGGAVLALILILSWLLGGSATPAPSPPAPVRVATAQTRDVPVVEHTIGTVLANATVQVKSLVDGQLLSAAFKEGQLVKTGDLLFQIEPKPFEDALHQAEGALARDQATLASNQTDLGRYVVLAKHGAISAQLRDQTAAQVKSLTATTNADQAAVDKAKFDLSNTQIHSPIDGKTGPILIQPGNLIKSQDTNWLVVITQIQPVKVSFSLPQTDLPVLQDRMRENALLVTLTFRNPAVPATISKNALTARVDFIGNTVDDRTGTIELRANYDNADFSLVPGEILDVNVQMNLLRHVVTVPREAVNTGQNGRYTYVIGKDNKAEMRDVTVLYESETASALSGGVASGERVVTDGQLRLTQGVAVTIVTARRAAS